ncbi:MAG: mechanosensitive ion channel family protein [Lyngbya sp. HA4199-MV5]|jgi:small conductance mechanosensitive channel|nr:mechanosensitive ion channel family protein [Lyngbya sp. HA4199-MV5]
MIRFVLVSVLTFVCVVGWLPAARSYDSFDANKIAQLPSIPTPATPSQPNLPVGVVRLGNIEITPVTFDGQQLFTIASPTVLNRDKPGNQIPVEVRAQQAEDNLNRIIGSNNLQLTLKGIVSSTAYNSETLKIYVAKLNSETTILARDETHPLPLPILSVIDADATYQGIPIEQIANSWRDVIDRQIHQALLERSTPHLEYQILKAVLILFSMIAGGFGLRLLRKLLRTRDKAIKAQQEVEAASSQTSKPTAVEDNPAVQRLTVLSELRHQSTLERQRRVITLLKWLVFWGQMVLWVGGTFLILSLFPWTKPLSWDVLSLPLKLLGIWFIVGLSHRVADALLTWLEQFWNQSHLLATEDEQRESLRIATTVNALKGVKIAVVYAIALISGLWILGATLNSILAVSGLIVVAVSLSVQNLVKDLIIGFLILWEDQFGIGDIIVVQNTVGQCASGLVENLNLRITQIRNDEGHLITISNSTIVQTENMTRSWSRVNFVIEVAETMEVNQAIALIQNVAYTLYEEQEWREQILEPPEILGVDEISATGMSIRVWIKTKPAQQWRIERELRRRVRMALDQHRVAICQAQPESLDKTS